MATENRTMRARGIKRRQELLDACLRIIATKGMGGVTHRAVADEAGVPASSTTYFFSSLDELVAEAVRSAMDAELERIRELEAQLAGAENSSQAIDSFVDFVSSAPSPHTVAQFEMYLHASRNDELQAAVAEIVRATRDVAADTAKQLGIADPSVGRAIIAMIDGFALHQIADPSPENHRALRVALTALSVGYGALERARHLISPSEG